jgi:hypothetical protein
MRKIFIMWLGAVLLAGCGGSSKSVLGEGAGGGTTGTTTDPVASVVVTTSTATIAADGSTSATISAVAKDAKNNFVSGATVAFSSSAGGLAVTQATTNATGLATATLTAGTAASGTAITVTASTQGVKSTVSVTVGTTQQTIKIVTSQPAIATDGSTSATITALVLNARNQFVAGVTVNFTSDSGGLTVNNSGVTNANGAATATLNAAGDPTDRVITVTAAVGTATASVPVSVTGTVLTVTGPTNLVLGSQGTFTVSLTEGANSGIANQTVTLKSAKGNTLTPATVTTNATGQQTFTLTAVNGGTDTITASSLNLQSTASVAVSTQSFVFTAPTGTNPQVNLGSSGTLTVVWTNGGVPQVGQTVTFSTTRGTLSSTTATTASDGTASVTISSSTAGPATISATASGVTAQTGLDFVSILPNSLVVQASPSTIAINGQSTITATVRDANNNLVEGQVVDFLITQDPTGGALTVPSSTTNVQGQASTTYTASSTTSATNGVMISATVAGATSVTGTTSLTVGGETVFLSLGTGNTITPLNSTQYEMPWTVQAVDASGAGVNNVNVTFAVTSLGYRKGYQLYPTGGTQWVILNNGSTAANDPDVYSLTGYNGCLTEDLAGNGIYTAAEDYNGNGKLDPGLVASTDVSSATTANGGTASVNLIYPKDHSQWVAVKLTATATVAGSQSGSSASFWLPVLAADIDSSTVEPPGLDSPYGLAATCRNPN